MDKTDALKINKGNFDKLMTLSPDEIHDLNWWYTSISSAYNPISHGEPQVCITTDASLTEWGCSVDDVNAGGNWTPTEAEHHINYLEMLAVFFALKSFSSQISGKHVKVLIDNTTAVAGINQMGTCHSRTNHRLACRIWEWCVAHNIWLTVAHIPGIENITADRESRVSRRETEWQLNKRIYSAAIQKIGVTPNIDLFASQLNFQIERYIFRISQILTLWQ
jgi:hypothetical protein